MKCAKKWVSPERSKRNKVGNEATLKVKQSLQTPQHSQLQHSLSQDVNKEKKWGVSNLTGSKFELIFIWRSYLAEKRKSMKRRKLETQEQENLTDQGAREWRKGCHNEHGWKAYISKGCFLYFEGRRKESETLTKSGKEGN